MPGRGKSDDPSFEEPGVEVKGSEGSDTIDLSPATLDALAGLVASKIPAVQTP